MIRFSNFKKKSSANYNLMPTVPYNYVLFSPGIGKEMREANVLVTTFRSQLECDLFGHLPHLEPFLAETGLVVVVLGVGLEGDPLLDKVHGRHLAHNVAQGALEDLAFGNRAKPATPVSERKKIRS